MVPCVCVCGHNDDMADGNLRVTDYTNTLTSVHSSIFLLINNLMCFSNNIPQ